MELLRGEDLASRLERKGPPAVPTALSILEQAARGLAAGHRAGLIHRDVKPGNIFQESGDRVGEVRVKVLDFGIAELTSADGDTVTHLTIAGRSPFSPAFASPEQLRGEGRLTPATDVFSLGAVGFQILTGQRPFVTPEPRQLRMELSRSLSVARRRLESIDPALPVLLQRALAESPLERFPHAAAFADELAPVLARVAAGGARSAPGAGAPERRVDARELVLHDSHADATQLLDETLYAGEEASGSSRLARDTRWAESFRLHAEPTSMMPAAQPPASPEPLRTPGRLERCGRWIRRAGAATLSFLFTVAATGAFAASWFAAFVGLDTGDLEMVYLGAAGAIVATPVALHRLMGRRGMLGLTVFASLVVTLACVYWLNDQPMEIVLGTVFAMQLIVCVLTERVTSSRGTHLSGAEADDS